MHNSFLDNFDNRKTFCFWQKSHLQHIKCNFTGSQHLANKETVNGLGNYFSRYSHFTKYNFPLVLRLTNSVIFVVIVVIFVVIKMSIIIGALAKGTWVPTRQNNWWKRMLYIVYLSSISARSNIVFSLINFLQGAASLDRR